MPARRNVPEMHLPLCETCGYILAGLDVAHNCPECGRPIAQSQPCNRRSPRWEETRSDLFSSLFWSTTAEILFHPARFFRALTTRQTSPRSRRFAHGHWIVSSLLLTLAADFHLASIYRSTYPLLLIAWALLLSFVAVLPVITVFNWLVAKFTAFEADWRGLRMPREAITKALNYHAATYLLVSLLAVLTTGTYAAVAIHQPLISDAIYLEILTVQIILSAIYLFWTYWIAMRNIMYANS